MPVQSARLGDGTLTIGTTPLDVSAQVVGCWVRSSAETGDTITVLSGDQLTSGLTTSGTLEGTMILDPNTGGVGEFTWTNHGTEQAFVFTPNTAAGLTITGLILITRLDIGADEYGTILQPEFAWSIIGDPTPVWGPAAP